MRLTALKSHGYSGRIMKAGQQYDARPADARVLILAGLARECGRQPAPAKSVQPSTTVTAPAVVEDPPASIPTSRRTTVSTREDKPKRSRRYKRRDMNPEEE